MERIAAGGKDFPGARSVDVIEIEPNATTAIEPPKRWKNWWMATNNGMVECGVCGATWGMFQGESVADHCWTHPSRDVAETEALEHQANPHALGYIGAYPEGECP